MSYSIDAPATGRRAPRHAPFWRAVFGVLLLAVLASCDNGNYGYCYNCGAPPTEISQGVVTGNFNGTPFASESVVALSSLQPMDSGAPATSSSIWRRDRGPLHRRCTSPTATSRSMR